MIKIYPSVLIKHIHHIDGKLSYIFKLKWYNFFKIMKEIKEINSMNEQIISYIHGIKGVNEDGKLL